MDWWTWLAAFYVFITQIDRDVFGQVLRGLTAPEHNCQRKIGVANPGLVPFYWLYASDGRAFHGRLHQPQAWQSTLPLHDEDTKGEPYAWIQVDLHREMVVSGILTQGDPDNMTWVSEFGVWYSSNCETFTPVRDSDGKMEHFLGNYDGTSLVTTVFSEVLVSRCIRIIPIAFHGNNTALRLELLGCEVGVCREAVIQHLTDANTINTVSHNGTLTMPLPKNTSPTVKTQSYAEFKFPTEQLVFGAVFYVSTDARRDDRYIITFSRNCHTWKPIRERRGYGDPMVFRIRTYRFPTVWQPLPYPVRAQCVRMIPLQAHRAAAVDPAQLRIQTHFIGCGTGEGILAQCGSHKAPRYRRVVGGKPSNSGQWPWLVSVRVRWPQEDYYRHLCGGSLIHPQWVLTAAHCVNVMYGVITGNFTRNYTQWADPEVLTSARIRLGDHSQSLDEDTEYDVGISWAGGRTDYNVSYYVNDIALLKLTSPVHMSDHVNTVCLPERATDFRAGDECRVMGWGSVRHDSHRPPDRPNHVAVPLVSNEACQKMYSHLTISPDMLCAAPPEGKKDSCTGDSGGPLVCQKYGQWYQAGIVSWNIGCGLKGYPGVYSKVGHFIEWISNIIQTL